MAAALASSLASSHLGLRLTLGGGSMAGGGPSSAEARLGALVGKLGHPLREVRRLHIAHCTCPRECWTRPCVLHLR